jgi:hypothetical protein
MHDQPCEPRALGVAGGRDQVFDRAFANASVARGEIDQIRGVRIRRRDAALLDKPPILVDLLVRVLGVLPALGRREKDLHALDSHGDRAWHASRQAARG